MKKISWVLMSVLWAPWASAESLDAGSVSAGAPILLNTTTINVDIAAAGEKIIWTGSPGNCTGPSGLPLEGIPLGVGLQWITTESGVHQITFGSNEQSWDVQVRDTNDRIVDGRVSSESWHVVPQVRDTTDVTENALGVKVYIKTLSEAVVEARLEGIDGEKLYLFATPMTVTGYQSKRFDDLVPGVSPSTMFDAMQLINPLYSNIGSNLSIYVNEIDAGPETDPEVMVRFEPCPDPADSPEPALVINSSSEGVHYTSCLGNGEYRWTKAPVNSGDNWVGLSAIDNTVNPLRVGDYECTTIVVREEIHLPLVGIGTAFEGIRLFRINENKVRKPMYMHWDDSLISGVHLGPGGLALPAHSPVFGRESGDPLTDSSPILEQGTGNARAWGNFGPNSGGFSAVMNTWGYVYSSGKQMQTISIREESELEALCAEEMEPEEMEPEEMEPEEMEPEEMEPEEMEPEEMEPDVEIPDESQDPPGFEGTATGGACATWGGRDSSFVMLALFAILGMVRRR